MAEINGTGEADAGAGERKPKRRGREARRAARTSQKIAAPAYLTRAFAPVSILTDETLSEIEVNADALLSDIGIEFRGHTGALKLFREAGCDVDGERVRFPQGLAQQLCATAPAEYIQAARNPERSVRVGGDATVFAPVYGSPFVHDLDRGRRYGTIDDFENFVRLAYLSPWMHHSGGTVCEPVDVPISVRHLDMVHAHMRLSDKPFMGSVTAPQNAEDSVALCRLLFGGGRAIDDLPTCMTSLINANSPLVWDDTMLGAAEVYARANQACIITPFILAGAMSPVTVAATLSQVLAEVLSGIAFTQLVRPGAPVVFGTFVSTVSMQSGAPTFGTPEAAQAIYGAAALARRLGLPFRSGGSLTASKRADAQAAYESANTLSPGVMAGVNFMLHAAGWMEGGLASSYEKFVMDCDQLGAMQKFAAPVGTTANDLGRAAFDEVGPGGHFLGCAHTQANYETAFHRFDLHDSNSVEQWEAEGSKDMAERANARWKAMLAEYEAPPLDPATAEALDDFVTQRKAVTPEAGA